jgi:hypothetical protein
MEQKKAAISAAGTRYKDNTSLSIHKTFIDFSHAADNTWPGLTEARSNYLIDLSDDDDKEIPYLLYRNGVGCCPRGDIQALTGKKKSGKTTAARIFITALLKGSYFGFSTPGDKPLRVLMVDTEQNSANVKQNTRRIHKALGWPTNKSSSMLLVLPLRQYDYEKRLDVIEEHIERYRPDFVQIDGISDLTKGANDQESSIQAVQKLMTLSAECHCAIMTVLHFNKSMGPNDTDTMRGHLGTELGNKATETYKVTRDDNTGVTSVEQVDSRNETLEPFAFTVEGEEDEKEIVMVNKADAMRDEAEAIRAIMKNAFNGAEDKPICATQLYERLGGKKPGTLSNVKKALRFNILAKERRGRNVLYTFVEGADCSAMGREYDAETAKNTVQTINSEDSI